MYNIYKQIKNASSERYESASKGSSTAYSAKSTIDSLKSSTMLASHFGKNSVMKASTSSSFSLVFCKKSSHQPCFVDGRANHRQKSNNLSVVD